MRTAILTATLAISPAALAASTGAAQPSTATAAAPTQQAPKPPCEYKTRMNFSIGEGTTGALHVRHVRINDAPEPTTELRMTIEAPMITEEDQ